MRAAWRAAAGIPTGGVARLASPALTPRAYASMTARSLRGCRLDHAARHGAESEAAHARVLRRAPPRRTAPTIRRPRSAATGPSGRSGPARARTRWRMRDPRGCAPMITGMPRASRSMVASAPRLAAAKLAVERRQAAMQRPPGGREGDERERCDADQGPSQPAQPPHESGRLSTLWERAGWSTRWCRR